MFYHIEGSVSEMEPMLAVIDCGGIGFALNVTANTLAGLKLGEKARLYVSESIGENNFDLYGFLDKNERRFFELLISVSGIGPKAAMSILSHSTPEGLALAIISGNEKALTVAPGIGKKIAQRVILELCRRAFRKRRPRCERCAGRADSPWIFKRGDCAGSEKDRYPGYDGRTDYQDCPEADGQVSERYL